MLAAGAGALGHRHGLRTAAENEGRCALVGLRAHDEGLVIAYRGKPYFSLISGLQLAPAVVLPYWFLLSPFYGIFS